MRQSLAKYFPVGVMVLAALLVGGTALADYVEGNFVNNAMFLDNQAMGGENNSIFVSASGGGISGVQSFLTAEGSGIASGTFATTSNGTTDTMPDGKTSATAAYIIAYAAWHYGLSPRTILATMQKEESLVTDPSPSSSQINYAMGYGCPDSAGCSTTYLGFYSQVMTGAWQLRFNYERANGNSGTWTAPDGSVWGASNILYACTNSTGTTTYYDTNKASGNYGLYPGNTVNWLYNGSTYTTSTIANAASASMYCYTPHAYKSGIYTGSYNFVTSWEAWWGESTPTYSWSLNGQYAFTDSSKTVGASTINMIPGTQVYLGISATNTGNMTWTNSGANPVRLGTWDSQDRNSAFCDGWSGGCNRAATLEQSSVAPGQTGNFDFYIKAPMTPGTYHEHFNLVEEGVTWFPDQGLNFYITVQPPVFSWQPTGQFAYTNSSMTTGASTVGMLPGTTEYIGFTAKNTGNMTWSNSGSYPIFAGTSGPNDRNSAFCDGWGYGCNRPSIMSPATVAPGQVATFEFPIKAPSTPGTYYEHFNLLATNFTWMNDPGLNFYMRVDPPTYSWQNLGQFAYTSSSKTAGASTTNLVPGQTVYVGFTAKNIGNETWYGSGANPVHVGTTYPQDRNSSFCDGWGLGCNRPAGLPTASVAPGQTATFGFYIKAPWAAGTYYEHYSLVAEGITWMNDPGLNFYITVVPAVYSWQPEGQFAYTDSSMTTGASTVGMSPGQTEFIGFFAKNTGNETWTNTGANPVWAGTSHPDDRMSAFCDSWGGGCNRPAAMLQSSVAPGQVGTFEFTIKAPATAGTYHEYFNLLSEGLTWMNDPGLNFYLTVQ